LHNVLSETLAALKFAKIIEGSPLPLTAWDLLRMEMIEGADVLGIGDLVGSLDEVKEAVLILIDLSRPPMTPVVLDLALNIVPNLLYAESG
jgi:cytosine/adenosine deaminase-related metal-dependent hydrolase